jgi:hypothetical protein
LRNVLVKYQKELVEYQINVHSDLRIWHSSFYEGLFECLVGYGILLCQKIDGMRSLMFFSDEYQDVVILKCVISCNVDDMKDVPFCCDEPYSMKVVDGFCELAFIFKRGCV